MNVSNVVKEASATLALDALAVPTAKSRAYSMMDSMKQEAIEHPARTAGACVIGGLAGWQLADLIGEAYDYIAN